jgi:serralysin
VEYLCCPPPNVGVVNAASTAHRSYLWASGTTNVSVRFIGGSEILQKRIAEVVTGFDGWNYASAIQFVFDNSASAKIRISFTPGNCWSHLGNYGEFLPQEYPTMNYGWFTDDMSDKILRSATLHEFGHALAFEHEHQHPKANIPWDVEEVYEYYGERGWSRDMVDAVVLRKLDESVNTSDEYDRYSIMHYHIVPRLVTDKTFVAGTTSFLSEKDRRLARRLYGYSPKKVYKTLFPQVVSNHTF